MLSYVRVPIKGRKGLRAWALVDAADEHLVAGREWHLNGAGYAVHSVVEAAGVRKELMARRVLGLPKGDRRETDHISRDKLDNRRCNLRIVSGAQNAQNRVRTDGNSRYRGVSRRKGKRTRPWNAYGCIKGVQTHLGYYDEEIEAARVAEAWRRVHLPYAVPDATLDSLPACPCRLCAEQ